MRFDVNEALALHTAQVRCKSAFVTSFGAVSVPAKSEGRVIGVMNVGSNGICVVINLDGLEGAATVNKDEWGAHFELICR